MLAQEKALEPKMQMAQQSQYFSCCSLEVLVGSLLLTSFLVSVIKMWPVCASNREGRDGGDSVEACVGGDIFYQCCYKLYWSPGEIDKTIQWLMDL